MVSAITSALQVILYGFSYDSVFQFLKTGLSDLSFEETDRLEKYTKALGIRGKSAYERPFVRRMKGMDEETALEELEKLNLSREKFVTNMLPILNLEIRQGNESQYSAASLVKAVYDFCYELGLQGKMEKLEQEFTDRGELAKAKEYGQANSKNIIMYIHGGGFVSGNVSSSKGYSSMLAKYSGYKVIAVDYSLAPEHSFPKGFDDCYNAFCEIARLYPDAKITKVACVLVHSPIIAFTGDIDRSEHEIDDFTVKEGCLRPLNEIYVGDNKADNPYISPLFGDFSDFPPTFITCDYN